MRRTVRRSCSARTPANASTVITDQDDGDDHREGDERRRTKTDEYDAGDGGCAGGSALGPARRWPCWRRRRLQRAAIAEDVPGLRQRCDAPHDRAAHRRGGRGAAPATACGRRPVARRRVSGLARRRGGRRGSLRRDRYERGHIAPVGHRVHDDPGHGSLSRRTGSGVRRDSSDDAWGWWPERRRGARRGRRRRRPGALRELHDRHVAWITARLRRRCADPDVVAEAVQDTFVAVWKGAGRWDGQRRAGGVDVGHRHPPPHRRAAHARPLGPRRRSRRAEPRSSSPPRSRCCSASSTATSPAPCRGLSPELRAVVQATVLDGLTTREAGRLLGIPAGHRQDPHDARPRRAPRSARMTDTTWHAPPDVLARYADDPGGVDDRDRGVGRGPPRRVRRRAGPSWPRGADADAGWRASWAAVADRIDRPRPSLLERVLRRLGVRSGPARLVGGHAGPPAGGPRRRRRPRPRPPSSPPAAPTPTGPFLVLAPLVPLAAVALTFAPAADPAARPASPRRSHGAGLAVRRAVAVLVARLRRPRPSARWPCPSSASAPPRWVLPGHRPRRSAASPLGTWVRIEVAVGGLGRGVDRRASASSATSTATDAPVADTAAFDDRRAGRSPWRSPSSPPPCSWPAPTATRPWRSAR